MPRKLLLIPLLLLAPACGPAAGEFGAPCATDAECNTGACFQGFAGGYCSQRCEEQACAEGTYCAALTGGSYCLQQCSTTFLDCRSDYYCADIAAGSVCYPDCTSDANCGAGARCEEKRCVAATPGAIGAACLLNVGCATGRCELAFNGGMCTQPCGQEAPGSFGANCPAASSCAQVSEAGGLCLPTCSAASPCREEYTCDGTGGAGLCKPRCRGAANCGLGFSCDRASGQCIEGSAPPRQTGAACENDPACDSSYCLDEPNTQFPRGVCSSDCTNNAQSCGASALCIVPSDPTVASVCLQKCASNFDCRRDYFCSSVRGSTDRVCIPRCSAVSLCNAPEVCDQFSGDCVQPGAAGTTMVQRVAIGDFAISGAQSSRDFTLDVPADALSFTLVLKGGVGGTSLVSRLTSPDGELLFDLDNYLQSKVRILPVNDGDFGMLFPNSPRVAIRSGQYRFSVVNENGSGNGEVFALIKRGPNPVLSTGNLDVNLWFTGVAGVTAATAPTDASVQAMLAEVRKIYGTVGITVRTVTYLDVPPAQAATFKNIDTFEGKDSKLRKLFELSAGAPNTALNFFLVETIGDSSSGFTILGIAGGIPGIPFEQGTNASGVAVTTIGLKRDATGPVDVARTLAHEGGHWLGLWHTTEQNGEMHDPLGDTPECPSGRDTSMNKIVTSDECVNAGANNLMFWEAGDTAAQLSGNQGFVLLRNPVVASP